MLPNSYILKNQIILFSLASSMEHSGILLVETSLYIQALNKYVCAQNKHAILEIKILNWIVLSSHTWSTDWKLILCGS